jgi:TrmH family RNA methyltransferase
VVLDGVQDPGNAGAIVRAAEAFGAAGVLFLRDTAGPFNPKTVRASAGSLFRLPFVYGLEREAVRRELRARELRVLAAGAQNGQPPHGVDWTLPSALVIGSEAHGVSAPLGRDATAVRIPTRGVESLNASAAAAVLLYEASRQRAGADSRGGKRAARDAAGKALA